MSILKKLYNWVLSWGNSKYALAALFVLAFIESFCFPIPPDILLIALCLAIPVKSLKYAFIATIASVLGGAIGYYIGYTMWFSDIVSGGVKEFSPLAMWMFDNIPGFNHSIYNTVGELYKEYNFWVVFTAGFSPLPYKVITITAGVFDVNFIVFMVASLVSRGARFFLIAILLWKYGERMKLFIDKYFNILSLAFVVLLVGGFLLLKLLSIK